MGPPLYPLSIMQQLHLSSPSFQEQRSKMAHAYTPMSEKEGSPLLEKPLEFSSESGVPLTYVPSRSSGQSLFRTLSLHISYALCYSILIGIVIARYFTDKENVGPGLIYSKFNPNELLFCEWKLTPASSRQTCTWLRTPQTHSRFTFKTPSRSLLRGSFTGPGSELD